MHSISKNQIHRTLMLQGDDQIRQHKNLNPETSHDLEVLSARLASNPTGTKLSFITGLGLSDVGMPYRLSAVIIPTLRVLQRLKVLGFENMSYRVYQATDFIIAENGLDPVAAQKIAKLMHTNMKSEIDRHYSDLAKYIHLDFGIAIDHDSLDRVVDQLQESKNPIMAQIIQYADSKSKSRLSAYRYAAANIICNGHTRHPEAVDNDRYTLLVGGAKEKPFFQLGKDYEKENGVNTNIIPLIQSTGAIPTYYPQIGKERYLTPDNHIELPVEPMPQAIQADIDLADPTIIF